MTDKERRHYENKYRHLNLYFGHAPGWDELTLAGAQILDSHWPSIPFWLKHLWDKILPANYMMTKLEVFLQRLHLLQYIQSPSYRFTQIKEKFGGLCLYCISTPNIIHDIESASYHRCEFCGTTSEVGMTSGWFKTCCKECAIKHTRYGETWKEKSFKTYYI